MTNPEALQALFRHLGPQQRSTYGRQNIDRSTTSWNVSTVPFDPSQIYRDPDTFEEELAAHGQDYPEDSYADQASEPSPERDHLSLSENGYIASTGPGYQAQQPGSSLFDDVLQSTLGYGPGNFDQVHRQPVRQPLQPIYELQTPRRRLVTESSSPFFVQSSPTPVRPQHTLRRMEIGRPQEPTSSSHRQITPTGFSPARGDSDNQPPSGSAFARLTPSRSQNSLLSRPVLQQAPIANGISLVPVSKLPDSFSSAFPYNLFNAVQSKCYPAIMDSGDNFVMSAPTGSGKTVILELAIVRMILNGTASNSKVVYMAPTKALCSERLRDWSQKFRNHDLKCFELTGDTSTSKSISASLQANIIITTPEKWDSTTRKWKDHQKFLSLVRLILIDEIHMLKDARGATLEAVVSRMRTIGGDVRFVTLSATIPNAGDVAAWLGLNPCESKQPAHLETFSEEFRPVKLEKHVLAFKHGDDYPGNSQLNKLINAKLPSVISKHSRGFPILIFCPTKQSCLETADMLKDKRSSDRNAETWWPIPAQPLTTNDVQLNELLIYGVAFHHGDVAAEDRSVIEDGFSRGSVSIICCTSTLAVGVNLPCHLVIIKNTKSWSDDGLKHYSDLDMLQMMGRAGRPQFRQQGAVAVIMTSSQQEERYSRLASGQEPVESCLHQNLIEHLNAEISLGIITDMKTAKIWLQSTFLFVRMSKNPGHYKIADGSSTDNSNLDQKVAQICRLHIDKLVKAGLADNESVLKSTPSGEAMTRYCVRFKTMLTFAKIPERAKISEILERLVEADEFKDMNMKTGDKGLCQILNRSGIRFPFDEVKTGNHKRSIIVQADLGGIELPQNGKISNQVRRRYWKEKQMILRDVQRFIRCIVDCKVALSDAESVRHALELARSISAHIWDDAEDQVRQLPGIGKVFASKLSQIGIRTIADLADTDPAALNMKLAKGTFGQKHVGIARTFPRPTVTILPVGDPDCSGDMPTVKFKIEIGFMNEKTPVMFQSLPVFLCLLIERSDGRLLDFRRWKAATNSEPICSSAKLEFEGQRIICRVMCDDFAGTCQSAELAPKLPKEVFRRCQSNQLEPQPAKTGTNSSKKVKREKSNRSGASSTRVDNEILDLSDMDESDLIAAEKQSMFQRIEELEPESKDETASQEPRRRADGKLDCEHHCKDKTACGHNCCRNGLKGLPRPARRAKVEIATNESTTKRKLHQTTFNQLDFGLRELETPADGDEPETKSQTVSKNGSANRQIPLNWDTEGIFRAADEEPRRIKKTRQGSMEARSQSQVFQTGGSATTTTTTTTTTETLVGEGDLPGTESRTTSQPWHLALGLAPPSIIQPETTRPPAPNVNLSGFVFHDFSNFTAPDTREERNGSLRPGSSTEAGIELIEAASGTSRDRIGDSDEPFLNGEQDPHNINGSVVNGNSNILGTNFPPAPPPSVNADLRPFKDMEGIDMDLLRDLDGMVDFVDD